MVERQRRIGVQREVRHLPFEVPEKFSIPPIEAHKRPHRGYALLHVIGFLKRNYSNSQKRLRSFARKSTSNSTSRWPACYGHAKCYRRHGYISRRCGMSGTSIRLCPSRCRTKTY